MSTASETFAQSIRDAENLLEHFNTLNSKPPPPQNEVLKRAGLIMAMTAWETSEKTLQLFRDYAGVDLHPTALNHPDPSRTRARR